MRQIRAYTLVELMVIIVMIAIGTTIILAIHTRMQRASLDNDDAQRFQSFISKFQVYEQTNFGRFPTVEPYISEPDRISRFSDYRQRPAKALRMLFRPTSDKSNQHDETNDLRELYSPLDGAMSNAVLEIMAPNGTPADKCFSSYSYDPGHSFGSSATNPPGDENTVIFGHSPGFLRRHGRTTARIINAQLSMAEIHLDPASQNYQIKIHLNDAKKTEVIDSIYEDQAATLFNRDSYLNDLIPYR